MLKVSYISLNRFLLFFLSEPNSQSQNSSLVWRSLNLSRGRVGTSVVFGHHTFRK